MHEMSLADGVVKLIEDQAAHNDFQRVLVVRLEIGQLAHVDADALAFCFEAVAKGSKAEGARLVIERKPGLVWCFGCSTQVAIKAWGEPCPTCGSFDLKDDGGQDMRVLDLEVE
ncbi:MAG: hydrogenase maturation nickel metallochaperone HypA [Alphaproteobacteria bacterium]|nr:hydrogenase maturation nickel metallochaperone HypA [Alphaproteobacteria bacterium]